MSWKEGDVAKVVGLQVGVHRLQRCSDAAVSRVPDNVLYVSIRLSATLPCYIYRLPPLSIV